MLTVSILPDTCHLDSDDKVHDRFANITDQINLDLQLFLVNLPGPRQCRDDDSAEKAPPQVAETYA
jgi:hypothetical protein